MLNKSKVDDQRLEDALKSSMFTDVNYLGSVVTVTSSPLTLDKL